MSMPPADYDGPWKEVLEVYLPEVLAFFFPAAHADIDWAAGYQPFDKELQQVAPAGVSGDQAVDKLVQVTRRDGAPTLVLIHLEVQSQRDTTFAERISATTRASTTITAARSSAWRSWATTARTGVRGASATTSGAAPSA